MGFAASHLIDDYLLTDGRVEGRMGTLFQPVRNNATGVLKNCCILVALGADPAFDGSATNQNSRCDFTTI